MSKCIDEHVQRDIFTWIRISEEAEAEAKDGEMTRWNKGHATITAREVAEKYGVPREHVVKYLSDEIEEEKSCLSLPFTLGMVTVYGLMVSQHNRIHPVHAVEDSIIFLIEEDAEFAFSNSQHGHKSMYDVDSFQEYWSWLIDGFIPLLFDQESDYSEGFSGLEESMVVPRAERGFVLNYNRIIGGIRLRQERSWKQECSSTSDLWQFYGKSCVGGHGYELWPETWEAYGVMNASYEWWLYIHDDIDEVLHEAVEKETSGWLTDETRKIELGIPLYNAGHKVYSFVSVNFYFNRGGHIWKRMLAMSTFSTWWSDDLWWNIVFDGIWIFGLVWRLLREIFDMWCIARENGLGSLCRQYVGFWNLVDWTCILVGFAIVLVFASRNAASNELNSEMEFLSHIDEVQNRTAYRNVVHEMTAALETEVVQVNFFRVLLAMYPIINMIMLFKAFASQPRLSLVTRTLAAARNDLLHFLVVFVSIFLTYALIGVLLFGREVNGFTTYSRSLTTCFRVMMGDFDWKSLSVIGRIEAGLWFMSFMIFIVMLMMNMLLTIVMDSYSNQIRSSTDAETLWYELYELFSRWHGRRQGHLVSLPYLKKCLEDHSYRDSRRTKHETSSVKHLNLVTVDFLQEVCPTIQPEQAIVVIAEAVMDVWSQKHEHADDEEIFMDVREVNWTTKKLKSKIKRACVQTVEEDKEHRSVRQEQVADFRTELDICRLDLRKAMKSVASAACSGCQSRIQLTSVEETEEFEEFWIISNKEKLLEACRTSFLNDTADGLREESLGRLCRVLCVDKRHETVQCSVAGVGDFWIPVTTLCKPGPEREGPLFKWGEEPWESCSDVAVGAVPSSSSDVDRKIQQLNAELSVGRHTIEEAQATVTELELRFAREQEETARLEEKFAGLKRNVLKLTQDNVQMVGEVQSIDLHASSKRGHSSGEYQRLIASMRDENKRLKQELLGGSTR